jgi:hypothetical protein
MRSASYVSELYLCVFVCRARMVLLVFEAVIGSSDPAPTVEYNDLHIHLGLGSTCPHTVDTTYLPSIL